MRYESKSILFTAALCLLVICVLASTIVLAQQVTAAITGKVTDSSGAAIANAKVSATDTERGTVWPTITNSEGIYDLPRVPAEPPLCIERLSVEEKRCRGGLEEKKQQ